VTTLKSLSQKLCPQSVYDSTFGRKEREYLGINAKASKRRNDAKKSRLAWLRCACCCPPGRKESDKSVTSRTGNSNNNLHSLTNNNNNNNNIYSNNSAITNNCNHYNTENQENSKLLQESGLDENNNSDRVINSNQEPAQDESRAIEATGNHTAGSLSDQPTQPGAAQITMSSSPSQVNVIDVRAFSENVNEFDYIDLDVLTKELGNSESTPERRSLLMTAKYRSGVRSSNAGLRPDANMELNLEWLPLNSKQPENEVEC
jgi:hypothetical protein